MNAPHRHKIVLAVTSPLSWVFYEGLIGHLRTEGFRPILLSSVGAHFQATSENEAVPSFAVAMEREINPLKDLTSLCRLYRMIRRIQPEIVDASTPKAGLLVGIAGWLARVPCRIYSLRGLRLETASGIPRFRFVARGMDRVLMFPACGVLESEPSRAGDFLKACAPRKDRRP